MDAQADSQQWTTALNQSGSVGDLDGNEIAEYVNHRYSRATALTNKDWLKAIEEEVQSGQVYDHDGAEFIRHLLEGMGYDGLTHLETKGMGITDEVLSHRVYVAFEPTQIKSATPPQKVSKTYPDLRTLDTDVKVSPLKSSAKPNIGTFDSSANILKGIGVGAAALPAAGALMADDEDDLLQSSMRG